MSRKDSSAGKSASYICLMARVQIPSTAEWVWQPTHNPSTRGTAVGHSKSQLDR